MKRVVLCGSILVLTAVLAGCQPVEREPADVGGEIGELRDRYLEAYNRHDAAAVAELYADDAVFVDSEGTETTGRDQIQRQLEAFFAESRPRLTARASATEGGDRLAWELGNYQLELEAATRSPRPGEPAAAQPGTPGATDQPGMPPGDPTAAQPGTPGAANQPGMSPGGPMQARSESGHYLIVFERDDDRWRIRAQIGRAEAPDGDPMTQPPVTTGPLPAPDEPLLSPPGTGAETPPIGAEPTGRPTGQPVPPPVPESEEPADEYDDEPPADDGPGAPAR